MIFNNIQVENNYSSATFLHMLLLFNTNMSVCLVLLTLLLTLCFMEVVVHDGVIREKPSTPEEARKFIKGLCYLLELNFFYMFYCTCPCPQVIYKRVLLQGTLKAMLRQLDLFLLQM